MWQHLVPGLSCGSTRILVTLKYHRAKGRAGAHTHDRKTSWGAGEREGRLAFFGPNLGEPVCVRDLWGNSRWEGGGILAGGEASPLEALVGVVDEGEGGDDQLAGHAAELPAEPLHVLADALVPAANSTE